MSTTTISNRLKHRDYCAAVRCYNSRARQRNLAFFTFPREPDRCLKWVENCRGEELPGKTAEGLFRYYVLCAEHFEDSQFQDPETKTLLIRNAIPTLLNVPDPPLTIAEEKALGCHFGTSSPEKMECNQDVANTNKLSKVGGTASGNRISSTPAVSKVAAAPASVTTVVKSRINRSPAAAKGAVPSASVPTKGKCRLDENLINSSIAVAKAAVATASGPSVVKILINYNPAPAKDVAVPASSPTVDKSGFNSPSVASASVHKAVKSGINSSPKGLMPGMLTEQQLRYMETRRTLTKQRNQIVKLQKRVKDLKAKVKTRYTVDDIIENASKYMSGVPLDFFASQLRMASKKDNGRRWTEEDKFFALMLKCVSLEAYRLCSKVFNLPCTRTLQRWLKDYKQEVPDFEARLRAYKQKLMLNAGEMTAAEKALKSIDAGSLDSLATGFVNSFVEDGQDPAVYDQTMMPAEHTVMCLDDANLQTMLAEVPSTTDGSLSFMEVQQTVSSVLKAVAAPKKLKKPRAPRQKRATTERAPRKKRAKKSEESACQDHQSLELLASLSTIVDPQPYQELHMHMQSENLTLDPESYQLLASAGHLEAGTTFTVQEVNSEGTVILAPISSEAVSVMCNP